MADENRRCVDLVRRFAGDSDIAVLAQSQRLGLAVPNQRDAALGLIDLTDVERDWLEVAVGSGRFQARFLELRSDVFGRFLESWRADAAALQCVAREVLNVGPPARALGIEVGRAPGGGASDKRSEERRVVNLRPIGN